MAKRYRSVGELLVDTATPETVEKFRQVQKYRSWHATLTWWQKLLHATNLLQWDG